MSACTAPSLRWLPAILLLLECGLVPAAPPAAQNRKVAAPPSIRNVYWQPDTVQQGSPMLFSVEVSRPAARVTGTWAGKRLLFFRAGKPRLWSALAGVDLDLPPGNYDLHVAALLRDGRTVRATKSVEVKAADFGQGSVQVPQSYVTPNADEQREIAQDDLLKKRAFAQAIPRPLWKGDFLKAVDVPPTPSFGETRLLNEEKTSRHLGTDYPVGEGTPVAASNAGVVALATHLYYEGDCVILDHGDRFFTVYMHLSRIDVHRGERLRKGAHIGVSGATGRVTGPHLHFAARWNGAWLDPVALLQLTMPEPTAAQH
jgi:murein DD-endopeptidase MepM/ murein hydrolase activator NlpD